MWLEERDYIFSERLFCSSIANSICIVSDKTNLTKFVGIENADWCGMHCVLKKGRNEYLGERTRYQRRMPI